MPVTLVCQQCEQPFPVPLCRIDIAQFCSKACHYNWKSAQHRATFWSKVAVCQHGFDCPYCCWPFQGFIANTGYGVVKIHGTRIGSHRLAWELGNNQALPPGFDAAHYCHVRACANYNHIHRATRKENLADSVRDGRTSKGEDRFNSKLTEETASEAFRLKLLGWGNKRIADHLHVSKAAIRLLMIGENWKHIPRPAVFPKLKPPGPKPKQTLLF